ncbi:hypothetical protein GJ496_010130 [Pomphorhynchus laevis]|nr:hypothetical protein GJ496_010130 [Pomphorhynchus laevis]
MHLNIDSNRHFRNRKRSKSNRNHNIAENHSAHENYDNVVNLSTTSLSNEDIRLLSFAPMPREFERLKLVDSLCYMSTSMFHNKDTPDVLEARLRFLSSNNIQKYVSMCPNHRTE